jgi:predicted nucleic acid-binding protein
VSQGRPGFYVDTCLLVSLFHNDSGYPAAETWLTHVIERELWISHWVLLEFASATALRQRRGELESGRIQVLQAALEQFRAERLGMLEPRGDDFLLARSWVQELSHSAGLRAADALHLAVTHRHGLTLVSADRTLVTAAQQLQTRAELVG